MIQRLKRLLSPAMKTRFFLLLTLIALLLKFSSWVDAKKSGTTPNPFIAQPQLASKSGAPLAGKRVNSDALPIYFEPNRGQADAATKYLSRGKGFNLLFAGQEITLTLRKELAAEVAEGEAQKQYATETIRWHFVGANSHPEIVGEEALPGRSNYFLGAAPEAWRTNIPQYGKLRYRNLYPGIDLVFYGSQQGQLEYDFVLSPGANPKAIKFAFSGATKVSVSPEGKLLLQTAHGLMEQLAPTIYQTIAGQRREVVGKYQLLGRQQVGFALGKYDARQPLLIDPVLVYSTYYGGGSLDNGAAIALDKDGNIYVTGDTLSADFKTVNPVQGTITGTATDAFVLKLNPAGNQILYATYLGGNATETGTAIAVDANGNAYITGQTGPGGFPGASQLTRVGAGGNVDTFVCKLNPAGSSILYTTLLGGNNADFANAIAVNAEGNVYVAGRTDSTNLPASGIQTSKRGSPLFKSTDQAASWSKANNGITAASVRTFAVHPNGPDFLYAGTISGLYVSLDNGVNWLQAPEGPRLSSINSIVIDPISPHTIYVGSVSGFSKSNNDGSTFEILNSNIIGAGSPAIFALALAPGNPATIYAGTSTGVFKTTNGGTSWSPMNNGLRISPFISNVPTVNKLAIDPTNANTIYVGTTAGMFKSIDGGASWVAINTGLNDLIGNHTGPPIQALAMDASSPNTLYVAAPILIYKTTDGGATWQRSSTGVNPASVVTIAIDPNSPTTIYAGGLYGVFKSSDGGANWQRAVNGLTNLSVQGLIVNPTNPATIFAGTINGSDAYVAKLNADGIGAQWLTYLGGEDFDEVRGLALDASGNVFVTGTTTSTNFPTTANSFQPTMAGFGDAFVAKINATGTALTYSTYLGGTGSDSGRGIAINSQGEAFITGAAGAGDFPTLNSIQPPDSTVPRDNSGDAYVTRLKADGSGLIYSTFLGGNYEDIGTAIALDSAGNVYVTGSTASPNFPTKAAFQPTIGGGTSPLSTDAFVTKINPTGSALVYSSYLGGFGNDVGNGIAVDKNGDAHVVGTTFSTNFPTVNSLQPGRSGGEIFIAKLGASADLAVTMTASAETVNLGENLTYTIQVTNGGELPTTDVTLTDPLPADSTVVSVTANQGICTDTGTINCALGTMANGTGATVTIVVKPPASQTITNTVSVTGTEKEATLVNNSAAVQTKVTFTDVALSVSASHLQLEAGKNLTWFLTVKNNGPMTAKSVVITDNLPADIEFVSCQAMGKGVCAGTGNARQLTVAELEFGAAESFVLVGKVKASVAEGTTITHQSSVLATPPDNMPANNQESSTIKVIKPDLVAAQNGKLAYISSKNGASSIAIANVDGSGRFLLTSGFTPAWSPDGLSIAFTNDSYELWVINANGTGLRKLSVSTPYPTSPTWTPDSTRLVYFGSNGLFMINADGTNERQLAEQLPALIFSRRMRLSPDGSRVLIGNSQYNNGGIATVYLDGRSVESLTRPANNSPSPDQNPAWSPDGSQIVFTRTQQSANGKIYVMKADGTDVKQLTTGTTHDDFPVFSPDGSQIAFTRGGEIWMMNVDGTNQRKILSEGSQGGAAYLDWQRVPSTLQPSTFVISGRIINQGPRFVAPKIELTGTVTATTRAEFDGVYSFGNLPAGGTYTVSVSDPSFSFTPATRTFTNLQAHQANADFTATFAGKTISGRIVDAAGGGIEGARVWLYSNGGLNLYTNTDGNGEYAFTDLYGGIDYTVTPLGYNSTELYMPANSYFPALSENRVANFKGQREKLLLTTNVFDETGAAVSGVTVTISGINGSASNSINATTISNGKALFGDLLSGYAYTVTAKKDNLKIEPATRRIVFNRNWELNFHSGVSAAATVSSASYSVAPVTPDGIVSLFGTGLAAAPKHPDSGLVYKLDGVSVWIENSDNTIASCLLFYVSPTQVNFLVPTNSPTGEALVRVYRDNKVVGTGTVQIANVAPGLFAMNQAGKGVAAASVLRVKAGNKQSYEFPYVYDSVNKQYNPLPIDLGPDLGDDTDQVFLELYGTGLRKRSSLENVSVKIGGIPVEVTYAGLQSSFSGLDQVNVKIPRSLIGRGEVNIELTVDGKAANPVSVNIK